MIFRLTAAQLIAQTYGDSFTPDTREPPHILAGNFPNYTHISGVLATRMAQWRSSDVANAEVAVAQGVTHLAQQLSSAGNTYTLSAGQSSTHYIPINEGGQVIGHATIPALLLNGNPVTATASEDGFVGMVAYVFIAVAPA